MRAVVQRVNHAAVHVDGETVAEIDRGLLVFLGVARTDTLADVQYLARKIVKLRIFEDADGKMNLSLRDVRGGMLVVSQFTLLGDCRKGRRPSFVAAAPHEKARTLYHCFIDEVEQFDIPVAGGRFQEHMHVALVNDGPVTLLLDSTRLF